MILAHIYFHHFLEFRRLQLHDGLNTLFLHLIYFVEEFSLIDHKDLSVLDDLTDRLKKHESVLAENASSEDMPLEAVGSTSVTKSKSKS